jgi:hypothetical protein
MSNFSAILWREQVTFDELMMISALSWYTDMYAKVFGMLGKLGMLMLSNI